MRVTAVVVTFNAESLIGPCLDALRELDLAEIVVRDNASTDATSEVVQSHTTGRPPVTFLTSATNDGFGRAVNASVAAVPASDAVLLVNPDCILGVEVYEELVRYLSARPDVSAVAPAMVDRNGTRTIAGGAKPTLLKELLSLLRVDDLVPPRVRPWLARRLRNVKRGRSITRYLATFAADGPVELDWVSGFCMLVRTSDWHSVGGFDPAFFLYYEDVDLCDRLRAAGGAVVCLASVAATHLGSASTARVGKGRLVLGGMRTYFAKSGAPLERRVVELVGR